MFPFIFVLGACQLDIQAPIPPLYIVEGYTLGEPVLEIRLDNCSYFWGFRLNKVGQ